MAEALQKPFIHPSSVVDDGAIIGDGTKIWHFCHVFSGAKIGRNCGIGQGCSIAKTVVIGDGCKLQNGISVYDGVVLEEDVFCGPHMVFTNVHNPRAFVERKHEYRQTRICKGASIGAGAVIVCGITVGAYAFVGAGSVVTKDVKPYALVYGNPARQYGWVSREGDKLNFNDGERAVSQTGAVYVLDGDNVNEEGA
ncbi:MAG: N-acetyltransferase [Planctomycetes bacterium]|nr:N-acetyltransferase [Planctomycetota bacterium]